MEGGERADVTWHCSGGSQRAGVCVCVCAWADERGRKINPSWNCTRSAELVRRHLAFLIIPIHPSQGSGLQNPASPQHRSQAHTPALSVYFTQKDTFLLQWAEDQSIVFLFEEKQRSALNFSPREEKKLQQNVSCSILVLHQLMGDNRTGETERRGDRKPRSEMKKKAWCTSDECHRFFR